MGAPRAIALCQNFKGALEFRMGNWAEAEEALRESIRLFRQIDAVDGEALSCLRLGILQTARGELDEALSTLEDGAVAAKHATLHGGNLLGWLQAAIARNRLLAGDLPAAGHAFSLGEALTESHGDCALCEAVLLPVAVSVRLAQGDLTAAEAYCRRLDADAARYDSHTWLALAAQARGELAAARGDVEAARTYYTTAQAGFHQARNEYAAAQCAEALARLL